MSRVFHRPMFRKGGDVEGGITSGLRSRYDNGGGALDIKRIIKESPEAWESYQEFLGDYPKSQSRSDFLINFGLDLASRSPSGNIVQTAAESAKEPFKIMQQQEAYDKAAKRQEKKDFMDAYIKGQADIWAGESAGQIYSQEKLGILGQEALTRKQAHVLKWQDIWSDPTTLTEEQKKERQAWMDEKESIQMDLDRFKKDSGIDIEAIISAEGGIDNLKQSNKKELLEGPLSEEMMTHPKTGEQITVAEYYEENPHLIEKKIIEMTNEDIEEIVRSYQKWPGAKGGRAGYQQGNLVEQMDVDVMTPKGEMAMQETVEEGVMPDQLSFEELRSRLPVEITDDIINLLVSSASALGDFAQIQTQQDVDNFNAKYGVNLVLPSEA